MPRNVAVETKKVSGAKGKSSKKGLQGKSPVRSSIVTRRKFALQQDGDAMTASHGNGKQMSGTVSDITPKTQKLKRKVTNSEKTVGPIKKNAKLSIPTAQRVVDKPKQKDLDLEGQPSQSKSLG